MSWPSIEALTSGKCRSASTAALTKNDMKPRRTPCSCSKRSRCRVRNSITGCMFTSLNVVRIAAVRCASTSRSATRARSRAMGAGFGLAATGARVGSLMSICFCTSSLSTRPPLPLPNTWRASSPCSSINRFAAGMTTAAFGTVSVATRGGFGVILADLSRRPTTSPDFTVVPAGMVISVSTPSTGAGTSKTTLSVSTSASSSPRTTGSPGCLCQVRIVPSVTDSGKTGTVMSVLMALLGRIACHRSQGLIEQLLQLADVQRIAAHGRRRRGRPAGIFERRALRDRAPQAMLGLVPGALVACLFLAPDETVRAGITLKCLLQFLLRKRIELFKSQNRDVAPPQRLPPLDKIIIELAAAQDDLLHGGILDRLGLEQHRPEAAERQILQTAHRKPVTQQAFWCHDHQRLAARPQHLAAQQMKKLRRGRRHAHEHVLLGAELEIPFESPRGMFRALAFVAVRQEQRGRT